MKELKKYLKETLHWALPNVRQINPTRTPKILLKHIVILSKAGPEYGHREPSR
jgi:hypothetical protein